MNKFQYTHLAQIYEHLMRKIDYRGWAEYLLDIIDYYELEVSTALELAAGNCKLTNYLLPQIPTIVASDLSYQMLQRDKNANLPKVACDMTRLPFKPGFDFILCSFDSVNYLPDKEAIRQFLIEAGKLLTPSGLLTFDVSLERNSIKNVKHLNRKGNYRGISYRQESKYLQQEAMHLNRFEIRLPDGTACEEVHEQKIYEFADYFEVIDGTNLYVSNCFDFFTFANANPKCERVQFILGKIE